MRRTLPALALLALLSVSACGGGGEPSGSAAGSPAASDSSDSSGSSGSSAPVAPDPTEESLAVPTDPICADLDVDAAATAAGLTDATIRVDAGTGDTLPPPFDDGPPLANPQCSLQGGGGSSLDLVVGPRDEGTPLRRQVSARLEAIAGSGVLDCDPVRAADDVGTRAAVGYACTVGTTGAALAGLTIEMAPEWTLTCELVDAAAGGDEGASRVLEACSGVADSLDP